MKQILTILILFTSFMTCFSQSVRASVESSDVYLGQPFEYRIVIEGTTDGTVPDLGNVEGISIEYKGVSTSMVSSLGMGSNSTTKTVTHSWTFTALDKGSINIPAFSIEVDGKVFKTASGNINVKSPEAVSGFHLFIETGKESYWEGEPIDLTIKWLFSSSVSAPRFNLPFINSDNFAIETLDPAPGNDVFKLNIGGLEVLAMQSAEIFEGEQYSSLSFQLKVLPQETGKIIIEPITLAFDSTQNSNGFRSSYKTLVIPSNSLELTIEKLPDEAYENGMPVILSRGKLSLTAEAAPLRVHIGDPLTFTITVSGAVTPSSIDIPSLQSMGEFSKSFSIPDRRPPVKVNGERASFSQIIRVKSRSVSSIPGVRMKYFNIETGNVETVSTAPIPLDVLETEVVTSANLENLGYTSTDESDKKELLTNDQGILFNFDLNLLTGNSGSTKEIVLQSPIYLLLFILPVLLYLIFVIIGNKSLLFSAYEKLISKKKSGFTTQYNSLMARNVLSKDDVYQSIRSYLSEYCEQPNKSFTACEFYNMYIQIDNNPEVAAALEELLLRIEETEYSREKKDLDLRSLLTQFYSLTMEFK